MSSKSNNVRVLAVTLVLLAACAVSSAQTPGGNTLLAKQDLLREIKETAAWEKEYGPAASRMDLTADRRETGETITAPSTSPQAASSDSWQFQLTPYLWIPTISGRAGIGNLVTDTTTSIGDSDVELNFGVMGTLEARKNRFIILLDLQYSDIATERGNPGPLFSSSRASFKTFVLDPEVGYRVLDNGNGGTVDVLGGIRYWHLNANLAFRPGILPAVEASRSRSWIDGVVGLRGKAALSQRFFLTGKADLGGGGSKFTYQLFGGLGINVGKRMALVAGYRDLNVNYDKDNFLFDMSLHGPIFGLGMKF